MVYGCIEIVDTYHYASINLRVEIQCEIGIIFIVDWCIIQYKNSEKYISKFQ